MNYSLIIGVPTSGSENVANTLSHQLGWGYFSLQQALAEEFKCEFEKLLILHSEITVAECAVQLLREVTTKNEYDSPTVISLPADTLDYPKVQQWYNDLPVQAGYGLTLDIATLANRIGLNRPRSMGLGAPRAMLRQMLHAKTELWHNLGLQTLSVEKMSEAEIVAKITTDICAL